MLVEGYQREELLFGSRTGHEENWSIKDMYLKSRHPGRTQQRRLVCPTWTFPSQTVGAVTAHMMSRPHLYTRMLEEASDIICFGELAVIARDFVHTNATLIRCNLFDHCRDVCKNV